MQTPEYSLDVSITRNVFPLQRFPHAQNSRTTVHILRPSILQTLEYDEILGRYAEVVDRRTTYPLGQLVPVKYALILRSRS